MGEDFRTNLKMVSVAAIVFMALGIFAFHSLRFFSGPGHNVVSIDEFDHFADINGRQKPDELCRDILAGLPAGTAAPDSLEVVYEVLPTHQFGVFGPHRQIVYTYPHSSVVFRAGHVAFVNGTTTNSFVKLIYELENTGAGVPATRNFDAYGDAFLISGLQWEYGQIRARVWSDGDHASESAFHSFPVFKKGKVVAIPFNSLSPVLGTGADLTKVHGVSFELQPVDKQRKGLGTIDYIRVGKAP